MKEQRENKQKRGMMVSVRALFGILFFLLMIGTILLSCLFNSMFLERYYVSDRKNALIRVYTDLQNASVKDLLQSDDFDISLRQSLRQGNVSLLVMDSGTRKVKVWSADESVMEDRLYANIFGITPVMEEKEQEKETGGNRGRRENGENEEQGQYEEDGYISNYVIVRILEQEQPYTINVVLDRRGGTRSLEMWGPLGESSFFLLRSPLEDIRSSAAAANRFFGYVGVGLAVAGAILAWWLSRLITAPIRQLTEISDRMKSLDFSAKYEGRGRTELDLLGRNMNEVSQKLEETISALRTANNDLRRDLDRRNREEEMRREFLSNVTHELKTPIALVRGYAEGLQDGIADDPENRAFYLETIVEESDRMNNIVQKVLQLNQLEFGDGSVSMERFDITALISNYLENASILAQKNGLTVQFEQKDPLFVWGDPFLIQEVFQNYYSNALNHADGEKVIDIRCEPAGDLVRVTVFNTGNPIPEKSLPHIWEKFYKVDKARTRAYGGSGVGLSIVKAIMDLHNRDYGVENYENGVAFWFELDRSGDKGSS